MAYTRITNTRNGRAAIRYAFEEPSHKKGMDRVLASSGVNLDVRFAMQQMRDVWKAHGKDDGNTVQMYRIIQSFGLDELDPNNPDDVQRANEIGQALASELYPDKQSLIVTQADGEGGKLHNHILVNSVSFTDGKSLRGYRKEHEAVAEKTDEILVRYGMKPLDTENTRVKRTSQEKRLAEQGKYVWKDDLRGRIDDLLKDTSITSREVFIERLRADFGVEAVYTDKRKYITYYFEDADGTPRRSRDNKLGTDYGKEALVEQFETNKELQKAEEQRRKEQKNSLGFDFDFDAELQAIRKPKRSKDRAVKAVESPLMRQVREEREMDNLHAEALRENERFDEVRKEKLREEQRRAEAERVEKERQEKAEKARREQELKEQQERERQEQLRRELVIERIRNATTAYTKVSPELVEEFIKQSEMLKGQMKPTITGERVAYSDFDIYRRSQAELKRKASGQEQSQLAVEVAEQDFGPEI